MESGTGHIFTLHEAAIGYARSAQRIFNDDYDFLSANPSIVPILVSHLFQSVEISIKYVGIASGLFTESEARSRANRAGHGIKELATLAVEKLGGDPFEPILLAITRFNTHDGSKEIIRQMICGAQFEKTRECYASRRLGYGQVVDGDFALVTDVADWISAVNETANNLPKVVDIISQWKSSSSRSKHFALLDL